MSFTLRRKQIPRELTGCCFRRAEGVLATRQGEELVLLDTRGERYYTLNDVGAVAWDVLAEPATCAGIVEGIRREFDEPDAPHVAAISADVARLLEQLLAARLVAIDPSWANMTRLAPPSIAATMLRLALLKASLGAFGFARTMRWIRRDAERAPLLPDVDDALVARCEYAVAMAAALYPGRAACLERSLVLYWWLRRAGVVVQLRMGAQLYPFLAHAWVERDGRVINDVAEHVKLFRPIEGIT